VPASFDVRELAVATAVHVASNEREAWLAGNELRRWLLEAGIARPNGAKGRLEPTERGAALVALVARLRHQRLLRTQPYQVGCEICSTISPTFSSFAPSAMSACASMPTNLPSSSTGSRRTL
jgi:hypothetical protein